MRHLGFASSLVVGLSTFAAVLGASRDARACGGCFHAPPASVTEATVVTDHRMAFALSPTQTVLWDQVKYAGNPNDFVWVLPVRPGTRVELSRDPWMAALDASTQPIVKEPPPVAGYGAYGNDYGGGCGCGLASSDSSALATSSDGGAATAPPPVTVVAQSTVGPYETVTLRATDPKALETWLRAHGYDIPKSVQPTIDTYTGEGFDFIALRLRPNQGVQAMQPVRVISPGADASLPLRMVAAGVGTHVALTLYVIGEGRYEAQNFPNAKPDDGALVWDYAQNRSNYQAHVTGLMAQSGERTWVTEYAKQPSVFPTITGGGGGGGAGGGSGASTASGNPTLANAYFNGCGLHVPPYTFKAADGGGGTDGGEAGAGDASAEGDAAAQGDAAGGGRDAGPWYDGGPPPQCSGACCDYDDLNVAMTGLRSSDVIVTRLRAYLPVDALRVGDLRLIAAADQTSVENVHQASAPPTTTPRGAGLAPTPKSKTGSILTLGAALLAVASMLRKRSR